MRQILFRGKDKDGNWHEGDIIHGDIIRGYIEIEPNNCLKSKETFIKNVDCFPIEVIPETVGQFVRTDLYNGIKTSFFVGDIVKLRMPYQKKEFVAEIFYDDSTCAFKAVIDIKHGKRIDFLTVLTITKVIGNIHDNQELLNK